jgi:hypothetical protein
MSARLRGRTIAFRITDGILNDTVAVQEVAISVTSVNYSSIVSDG